MRNIKQANKISKSEQIRKVEYALSISFLSRIHVLTRDIDIAILSIRLSVTFRY